MTPQSDCRTIVLIGMRASGKSTIGRAIAKKLGISFLDLDDVVASEFPEPSIKEIWRVRGESAWRDAEVQCLERILNSAGDRPDVLALGGGVPCISDAREILSRAAVIIIYLHAPPGLLSARLHAEPGDRPTLTGEDVAAEIAAVLAAREPVYRQLAQIVIDTENQSPTDLTRAIINSLDL